MGLSSGPLAHRAGKFSGLRGHGPAREVPVASARYVVEYRADDTECSAVAGEGIVATAATLAAYIERQHPGAVITVLSIARTRESL